MMIAGPLFLMYACSGFSLIGFYLVTVLEEAEVSLPPLQVHYHQNHHHHIINIITIIIINITTIMSSIPSMPSQASLVLVIWRLLLSILSSILLLRSGDDQHTEQNMVKHKNKHI